MCSAHPLVEVNISDKFEENPSIGIGFIERTRLRRWTDGRKDGLTDRRTNVRARQSQSIIDPHILWWDIIKGSDTHMYIS